MLEWISEMFEDRNSWEWWMKQIFKFTSSIKTLPFKWDKTQDLMITTHSKLHLSLWYFLVSWSVLDCIYLLYTAMTANFAELGPAVTLTFILHFISRSIATFCGACIIALKRELSVNVMNQTLLLHRSLKNKYFRDPNHQVKDGALGLFVVGALINFIQPFIGPGVQHLTERHSIRYWGSQFLHKDVYDSLPVAMLFASLEIAISYMSMASASYAMILLYVHCCVVKYWLKEISERHMDVTLVLRLYRTLQVLDGFHKDCCSDYWWPMTQNAMMYLHVLINILLIKCHPFLPIPFIIMLVCAGGALAWFEKRCIKAGAELYEFSFKVRKDTMNCRKRMRPFGRSMRCLRAQISKYYFLKMSTFNTYFMIMVDHTVTVILTIFPGNH